MGGPALCRQDASDAAREGENRYNALRGVSNVSVIRKESLKGVLWAAALALLLGLVALWPQERPVGARRDGLAMNTVI